MPKLQSFRASNCTQLLAAGLPAITPVLSLLSLRDLPGLSGAHPAHSSDVACNGIHVPSLPGLRCTCSLAHMQPTES